MIALGCDHGGFELKKEVIAYLEANNVAYKDFGCNSDEAVDYPVYAKKVANSIITGECEKGILICGTGINQITMILIKQKRYLFTLKIF